MTTIWKKLDPNNNHMNDWKSNWKYASKVLYVRLSNQRTHTRVGEGGGETNENHEAKHRRRKEMSENINTDFYRDEMKCSANYHQQKWRMFFHPKIITFDVLASTFLVRLLFCFSRTIVTTGSWHCGRNKSNLSLNLLKVSDVKIRTNNGPMHNYLSVERVV